MLRRRSPKAEQGDRQLYLGGRALRQLLDNIPEIQATFQRLESTPEPVDGQDVAEGDWETILPLALNKQVGRILIMETFFHWG